MSTDLTCGERDCEQFPEEPGDAIQIFKDLYSSQEQTLLLLMFSASGTQSSGSVTLRGIKDAQREHSSLCLSVFCS